MWEEQKSDPLASAAHLVCSSHIMTSYCSEQTTASVTLHGYHKTRHNVKLIEINHQPRSNQSLYMKIIFYT
jgi:hypothetical protein